MPEHRSPLTMFIIKKHQSYGDYNQGHNSLKTATTFIVDLLRCEGHKVRLAEAADENSVQGFIMEFNPKTVILEALWVTPRKMEWLKKNFPKVRFVVRVNSETPFLAAEGIGVEWIVAYMMLGVDVAFNSSYARDDFGVLGDSIFLPNYYPMRKIRGARPEHPRHVSIGCFGAMRLLKNQTEQAFAAVRWARHLGKKLKFHMNDAPDSVEVNAIKKSVRAVIDNTDSELVLHPWLPHDEFLELVEQMDYCLQVSLSDSFNLTAADAVSLGVPLIGSSAVRWLPGMAQADTGSSKSIFEKLKFFGGSIGVALNHAALHEYLRHSVHVWNEFIEGCNV